MIDFHMLNLFVCQIEMHHPTLVNDYGALFFKRQFKRDDVDLYYWHTTGTYVYVPASAF